MLNKSAAHATMRGLNPSTQSDRRDVLAAALTHSPQL